MEPLSDIESIIQSQKWKNKSKSSQNSPSQQSPSRNSGFPSLKINSSYNSSQNSSQNSLEDHSQTDSSLKLPKLPDIANEKLQEMLKLAVPYKVLTEAIGKVVSRKIDPAIIPAFPMRGFGKKIGKDLQPKFEFLKPGVDLNSFKRDEIIWIKEKNGRTKSIKTKKLPPLYSPRTVNVSKTNKKMGFE